MWFVSLSDMSATIVFVQTEDAGTAQEWLIELSNDMQDGDSLKMTLDLNYKGKEGVMDRRGEGR